MTSIRQQKVARLLQRDLGEIFQQDSGAIHPGVMITVTVVRISPDLSYAKVYLSVFPGKEQEAIVKVVNQRAGDIRFKLGKRVKHQLRHVPELHFFLDDSMDYAERIDQLLQ
ncbi:MAG: 30S ribosome-binding factor RbfA [Bacteroidota bacterium]